MPKIHLKLSPWKQHVRDWKDCQRCYLASTRSSIVLARGELPCDVLFIGEAPGRSEDALGKPFVGPAGKLLDSIALEAMESPLRLAFTNLIGCIPLDDEAEKLSEPPGDAVEACSPRLIDLVEIARPKLLVLVGQHPQYWLEKGYRHTIKVRETERLEMIHPAAILRAPHAQQSHMIRRCVVTLRDAMEKVCQN